MPVDDLLVRFEAQPMVLADPEGNEFCVLAERCP